MNVRLILLLIWLPIGLFGQQAASIWVWDSTAHKGIPLARVAISGSGVLANADGFADGFFADGASSEIEVRAAGYKSYKGPILDTVVLVRNRDFLNDLPPKREFSTRFIQTALALRGPNNPENQPAYSYQSYNLNKIELIPDEEAIPEKPKKRWDRFASKSDMLLLESSTQVFYERPGYFNEVVTHARVSGFQDPSLAMLATRYQAFNFHQDLVYCFGTKYTSPLSSAALSHYNFVFTDSILDVRDATVKYVFYFSPKSNPFFDALEGEVIFDKEAYALCGLDVAPFDKRGLGLFVVQEFEKVEKSDLWFPHRQEIFMTIFNYKLMGYEVFLHFSRRVHDFAFSDGHEPGMMTVPDVRISDDPKLSTTEWDAIRPRPLTQREAYTYFKVDSIGRRLLFDDKLNWVKTLSTAQVRVKMFDLDIGRFVNYNFYEQLRLGLGGYTNERFSSHIRLGGWFGYGFADRVTKYGYSASVFLNRDQQLYITGMYDYDLYEAGGTRFMANSQRLIVTSNTYRNMFIRMFDRVGESRLMVNWHPLPNLHTRWFLSNQNRFVLHDYRFRQVDGGVVTNRNGFTATQLGFSVEWRPNDRYFQGTYLRRTIKRAKPVYRMQFAQSFKDWLGSELHFTRLDLQMQHQIQTLKWGLTSFEISGGLVLGDLPYQFIYVGRSNFVTRADGTRPPMISDPYAFETMRNNEFLSNRYIQVFLRHNFQKRLFKVKNWAPHLELVARGMIGGLNNPEKHSGIDFQIPNRGFLEAGFEVNKLWSVVGVGFYYRLGHYAFDNAVDNISMKMNIRLAN
jgi:hypothetical protein